MEKSINLIKCWQTIVALSLFLLFLSLSLSWFCYKSISEAKSILMFNARIEWFFMCVCVSYIELLSRADVVAVDARERNALALKISLLKSHQIAYFLDCKTCCVCGNYKSCENGMDGKSFQCGSVAEVGERTPRQCMKQWSYGIHV